MILHNILIIGMGLLGGSLGLALNGKPYRRMAWARRRETRELALQLHAADAVYDKLEDALAQADLTVLCLPVPVIPEYLAKCRKYCRAGSAVTDIGSVKGVIMAAAERELAGSGIHFTGSHPMAGTEKSGLENAFAELYNNADGFIVPGDSAEADEAVKKFWETIGVKITRIGAAEHDLLVAHTSHVQHVVASALALAILAGKSEAETALRFAGCATGFRDTCRIASSSPAMWREIISNNREAVLEAMRGFDRFYGEYRRAIETGNFDRFEALFAEGKDLRDSWNAYKAQQQKG